MQLEILFCPRKLRKFARSVIDIFETPICNNYGAIITYYFNEDNLVWKFEQNGQSCCFTWPRNSKISKIQVSTVFEILTCDNYNIVEIITMQLIKITSSRNLN